MLTDPITGRFVRVNPATCTVANCDKPATRRGWCTLHYTRWLRTGSVNSDVPAQLIYGVDTETRFWMRVNKDGPIPAYAPTLGACWLWTGKPRGAYGRFSLSHRKSVSAHRFSYELSHGVIPEGMDIDHLCRVTLCVRPSHLEAVTEKVNTLRGFSPHAINARKTACKNGHPYTLETTITGAGYRQCRICRAESAARRRQVSKAPQQLD